MRGGTNKYIFNILSLYFLDQIEGKKVKDKTKELEKSYLKYYLSYFESQDNFQNNL